MSRKSKAPRTPILGVGLVAVSDPETRARAVRALETCRLQVETTAEWTESVARVESEAFDVVVAEVDMPVVGGLDILRAIRYNRPDTLVFLVGRDASDEVAIRAQNLGAKGYLKKPLNEHKLALEVKSAHEEKINRRILRSIGIRGGKLKMVG
jgi:CheY-like chemotaxis protein